MILHAPYLLIVSEANECEHEKITRPAAEGILLECGNYV